MTLEETVDWAHDEMLSSIEKHGLTESWILAELEDCVRKAHAAGEAAGREKACDEIQEKFTKASNIDGATALSIAASVQLAILEAARNTP